MDDQSHGYCARNRQSRGAFNILHSDGSGNPHHSAVYVRSDRRTEQTEPEKEPASAYVCFATLFFYYGIILYLLVARHLFYGISMLDKFKGMGWKKPYLIFGMCDETFSINYTAEIPEDVDRGWFYFWVTFLNRFYWVSGATIGGHDRSASVETPDALVDRRWNRVLYAARAGGVCVKGGAH